jgi:DNA-directed RNA polymerase subunit RPC12/RpoP
MNVPYWLLHLLPMWEYICPKCRKEVNQNSHECPHCGEKYPLTLRVPPTFLKDQKKLEAYVHKHVFPRVSEFERNYLRKYFTILFPVAGVGVEGFETNDFTTWTATVGAPTIQAVTVHHGTYAMYINGVEYASKTLASTNALTYARGYFNFEALPPNNGDRTRVLSIYVDDGSEDRGTLMGITNDTGTIKWQMTSFCTDPRGFKTITSATPAIATGVWYCVKIMRTQKGTAQAWVDGTSIGTVSTTSDIANKKVNVGSVGVYSSAFYADCIVAADADIGCESSYSPSTRSSLPNTMMTMLNSKMLFSQCNPFKLKF